MYHQKIPGGNELLNPEKILKEELGIGPASYVADFGCGTAAYFVFQSAKIVGDSGIVYAVDIQKSILENVASRADQLKLHNIKTIWTDLETVGACKINDNSLDYGFLINILFQNKDHEAILKEVMRMVKPTGKILIIDWKDGRFPLGPSPQEKVHLDNLSRIAENLGLSIDHRFEAGQYHFGIIFKK